MTPAQQALLQGTALFSGFTPQEFATLLQLMAPQVRRYQKGEALLLAGYEANEIGVVLAGSIEAVKDTRAGSRFTVAHFGPGNYFGYVLSGGSNKSPVTVLAKTFCTAAFFSYPQLLAPPPGQDALFRRLTANLVALISNRYFQLDRRVDLLLIRGLRRRVAAYLAEEAEKAGSPRFHIPFNRTALAYYLGCERAALSREISRMAADGLIETDRNQFAIPDLNKLKTLL